MTCCDRDEQEDFFHLISLEESRQQVNELWIQAREHEGASRFDGAIGPAPRHRGTWDVPDIPATTVAAIKEAYAALFPTGEARGTPDRSNSQSRRVQGRGDPDSSETSSRRRIDDGYDPMGQDMEGPGEDGCDACAETVRRCDDLIRAFTSDLQSMLADVASLKATVNGKAPVNGVGDHLDPRMGAWGSPIPSGGPVEEDAVPLQAG